MLTSASIAIVEKLLDFVCVAEKHQVDAESIRPLDASLKDKKRTRLIAA
jgi:hypothetical protein